MTLTRLLPALALAVLSLASPAAAGSRHEAPTVSRPGQPLDPELLPANSGPGDCVVRRVTGPGGAYRWERIECENQSSWSSQDQRGHDQWGYGRNRLEVETRDSRPPLLGGCDCDRQGHGDYAYGDRYGDYGQRGAVYDRRVEDYAYGQSRGYDSEYVGGGYVGGSYIGGAYADGRYSAGGYVQGGYAQDAYSQQGYGQGGGYAYGDGYAGRREDRYGPSPSYVDYGYGGAAGRDQDGYLVWPGKLP
jgi:hypothetical protein